MSTILLKNCHLVSPDHESLGTSVLIENDRIRDLYEAKCTEFPAADKVYDLQGKMLMPGFIDVHCHGRAGFDFSDASEDAVSRIAQDKLMEGVTTILPTTLTLPENLLAKTLQSVANHVLHSKPGARIPGVHLEGPFINPKCLGAQNPEFVRKPDVEEVKRLSKIFPVLKVSYALEMEGGAQFARQLLHEGITPSCVHSAATYAQFMEAYSCGLRNLSHFCNQMTPLHHREIGLVGAGLLHEDVFVELICDKLHVCPDMVKLIFRVKDNDRILLISDAMRAAGMPDGNYSLGGLPVKVQNGEARLEDSGALAGSTLRIADALRNAYEITGLPLSLLVKTTSWNQAQSLGLSGFGKIEPGYYADLTVMDIDFKVHQVFVNGQCMKGE